MKKNRVRRWAKYGATFGLLFAIVQMFLIFGAEDAPVARTLGRLFGGLVIFGGIGAILAVVRNLFSKDE